MKESSSAKKRMDGIPVNSFVFPLLVVVVLLHIIIVVLFIDVNKSSNMLFDLMRRSEDYKLDTTSLQAYNTLLSETSSSYIQMPVFEDGSPNVGPLNVYAEQLGNENSPEKVLERFKTYDVSYAVRSYIEKAADASIQMRDIQLHAISLIKSVYPLPSTPILSAIPDIPLTENELLMPDEQRLEAAQNMILESDYVHLRYVVSENTKDCNNTLQQEFDIASDKAAEVVAAFRALLWITVIIIIVVLSLTFVLFYKLILKPVRKCAEAIEENQSIQQVSAITELHQLVNAFNNLRERRNKLESILRKAAETDALTGLPNRYSLDRDLAENDVESGPMCVLLFDVNFLKLTNDTKGHLAGDQLIRTAASCIKECFYNGTYNNCYRIGGDEFVVLLKGCNEDKIKQQLERFKLVLKRENIAVSVGYAYDENANNTGFNDLMEKADQHMYEQKRKMHEKNTNETTDCSGGV